DPTRHERRDEESDRDLQRVENHVEDQGQDDGVEKSRAVEELRIVRESRELGLANAPGETLVEGAPERADRRSNAHRENRYERGEQEYERPPAVVRMSSPAPAGGAEGAWRLRRRPTLVRSRG